MSNRQDEPISIAKARIISEKLKEADSLTATIRNIDKGTGIDVVTLLNGKDKVTIPKNYEAMAQQAVTGVLQIAKDQLIRDIDLLISELKEL